MSAYCKRLLNVMVWIRFDLDRDYRDDEETQDEIWCIDLAMEMGRAL
jgi:hypothetical protein